MALPDWLKNIWHALGSLLGAIGSFLLNFFASSNDVVDDINHIVTTVQASVLNIKNEIEAVKNFEFDPAWETRVINVPRAISAIQDLKERLFDDFRQRLETLVEPIHELSLILHQEAAPDVGDPQHAVSAISKGAVKLNEIVTMIHQLRDAIDTVADFIDLFSELREDLETLDLLFLPQGKPKQWVTAHYKKRVG
jgi:methyl-accepting chemotaxis protein